MLPLELSLLEELMELFLDLHSHGTSYSSIESLTLLLEVQEHISVMCSC